jgi:hypothetical protein
MPLQAAIAFAALHAACENRIASFASSALDAFSIRILMFSNTAVVSTWVLAPIGYLPGDSCDVDEGLLIRESGVNPPNPDLEFYFRFPARSS